MTNSTNFDPRLKNRRQRSVKSWPHPDEGNCFDSLQEQPKMSLSIAVKRWSKFSRFRYNWIIASASLILAYGLLESARVRRTGRSVVRERINRTTAACLIQCDPWVPVGRLPIQRLTTVWGIQSTNIDRPRHSSHSLKRILQELLVNKLIRSPPVDLYELPRLRR